MKNLFIRYIQSRENSNKLIRQEIVNLQATIRELSYFIEELAHQIKEKDNAR